jgi:small-conductance mechanosensitive channel
VNDSTNTSTAAVANNSLFDRITTVSEPGELEGGWAFSDEDPLSPVETTSSSNAIFGNGSASNGNGNTATAGVHGGSSGEHDAQQLQQQLQALQLQVEQLRTELSTAQAQQQSQQQQCAELQQALDSALSAAAAAEGEVSALSHVRRRLDATEVELEKLKLSASGALSSRRLSELEAATPRNTSAATTGGTSGAFFGSSSGNDGVNSSATVNANAALEVAQLQEQLQTTKLEVTTRFNTLQHTTCTITHDALITESSTNSTNLR